MTDFILQVDIFTEPECTGGSEARFGMDFRRLRRGRVRADVEEVPGQQARNHLQRFGGF